MFGKLKDFSNIVKSQWYFEIKSENSGVNKMNKWKTRQENSLEQVRICLIAKVFLHSSIGVFQIPVFGNSPGVWFTDAFLSVTNKDIKNQKLQV